MKVIKFMPQLLSLWILCMILSKAVIVLAKQSSSSSSSSSNTSQDGLAMCGDCWCVPEGGVGNGGTCPNFKDTGLYINIPTDWAKYYASFKLKTSTSQSSGSSTNSSGTVVAQPRLLTANGSSDCYPFAETVAPQNKYPQSSYPACVYRNTTSNSTVCAYKFAQSSTCLNREYTLMEYSSKQAALAQDNVLPVHAGACGVCSNAQDYAVHIRTLHSLQAISVSCATQYALNFNYDSRFDDLVKCYTDLGFSKDCSTLWANFAATNAALCASKCIASNGNTVQLNEGPPYCELAPCTACSADQFGDYFTKIGGVHYGSLNAGVAGTVIYPCDQYRPFDLNPCQGLAPTRAPAAEGGSSGSGSDNGGGGSGADAHFTSTIAGLLLMAPLLA